MSPPLTPSLGVPTLGSPEHQRGVGACGKRSVVASSTTSGAERETLCALLLRPDPDVDRPRWPTLFPRGHSSADPTGRLPSSSVLGPPVVDAGRSRTRATQGLATSPSTIQTSVTGVRPDGPSRQRWVGPRVSVTNTALLGVRCPLSVSLRTYLGRPLSRCKDPSDSRLSTKPQP